jgi:hypothetical protein
MSFPFKHPYWKHFNVQLVVINDGVDANVVEKLSGKLQERRLAAGYLAMKAREGE